MLKMYKKQRLREDEEQCIAKSDDEKDKSVRKEVERLETQSVVGQEQRCPARVRAGRRRGRVCGRAGFYGGYCFYHALRKNDSMIAMQQETPETVGKTNEKNEKRETPETVGETDEKRETHETVGKTDEKRETPEKVGETDEKRETPAHAVNERAYREEITSFEKAGSENMARNAELIVENTEINADDDDFFGDAEQGVKRYRHASKSRLRRLFERLFKRFKKA